MLGIASAAVGHTDHFGGLVEYGEAGFDMIGFTDVMAVCARIVCDHGGIDGRVEKSYAILVGQLHMFG